MNHKREKIRQRTITAHYATNTSHDALQERMRIYFMQGTIIDVRTVCVTVNFLFTTKAILTNFINTEDEKTTLTCRLNV